MKRKIIALLLAGMMVLQSGSVVFAEGNVSTDDPVVKIAAEKTAAPEEAVSETDESAPGSSTTKQESSGLENENSLPGGDSSVESETDETKQDTDTSDSGTDETKQEANASESGTDETKQDTNSSDPEADETKQDTDITQPEADTDQQKSGTETGTDASVGNDMTKNISLLSVEPLTTSSVVDCGICGANAAWSLGSDGMLTISGTGAIDDFSGDVTTTDRPGYYAYSSQITSVVIEEGITRIGNYAFRQLTSLTTYTMPSTLEEIGNGAFSDCINLTSAIIPDSVTTLGGGIFTSCQKVTKASLPSGLARIPGNHFLACVSLKSVDIPEGVTAIGYSAFSATGITNISLPVGLNTIEREAFADCDSLTQVKIPSTVTSMGWGVFHSCDNLTDVYFYGDCPGLDGAIFSNPANVWYLQGTSGWTSDNASKMAGTGNTCTLNKWQDSIGNCGENATWSLNSSGVLTISGTGAMSDYSSSDPAPWYNLREGILNVVINNGITSIGNCAFDSLTNLREVTIPDSVTKIGEYAFSSCEKLPSLSIPDSVTEIGGSLCQACGRLESVTLPSGLETISWGMFLNSGLKEIVIPASVTKIDYLAFRGCTSLANVSFEDNSALTTIGEFAFGETAITSISIPDSVKTIEANLLYGCTKLSSVKLPSGITGIPDTAFGHCEALQQITLPETVTSIGAGAFSLTGLTNITIPASVAQMGAYTFAECTSLKDVYFNGAKPKMDTVWIYNNPAIENAYAFTGVTANIHYPYGGAGWSQTPPADFGGTLTMIPMGEAQGSCGTSVQWMLGQNGELSISGTGAMDDYSITELPPWNDMKSNIKKVTVESGVTSIGSKAFSNCVNLNEISLGSGVKQIGADAFMECVGLKEVTVPASVESVGESAFMSSMIAKITFLGDCPTVGTYAFAVNPVIAQVEVTYHEDRAGWDNPSVNTIGGQPAGWEDSEYIFNLQLHDWQNPATVKEATCTSLAQRTWTCSICGDNKEPETFGSLKNHTAGAWTTTKEATCTAAGTKVQKCTVCGTQISSQTISAKGHSLGAWTTTKAATCTAAGTKVQKCTVCGTQINSQTISAKGHSFGSWTMTKAATVFAAKQESRTCSTCKKTEVRNVGSALTPTIHLNATTIPLKVGQSTNAVRVTGLQNGDYIKSWTSSNTAVATVSLYGTIKGKKKGTATLTVTLGSGKTAAVKVNVQRTTVKAKSISYVGGTRITMQRGTTYNILQQKLPTVLPITASQNIKFLSTNKKVATVSAKGVITAKAGGTAKIIMYSGSAKKVTFTVTVPKVKTKSISGIIQNLIYQKKGMTDQLKPVLNPRNSEEGITYKSSNTKVVTVSSTGKLKTKKKGKAVITIRSGSASLKINITVLR